MSFLGTALMTVPVITAVTAYLLKTPRSRGTASMAGALATLTLAGILAFRVFTGGTYTEWGGALRVDVLSAYLILVIGFLTTLASFYAPGYMAVEVEHGAAAQQDLGRYYFWFHLFTATMFWVVTADNLGMMWAAVEATTLASAFMVGFYGKPNSLEAAWKYILICTVGIALALLGTAITYAASMKALGMGRGTLNWSDLMGMAYRLDPRLMKLSFVLILVGYGTKAGFAPMHTWLPDAHSQAPTPVSAVLSGVLLSCALYAIMRFTALTNVAVGQDFASGLLMGFGLLSMAIAIPFTAMQNDVKRLLAYSSIEHMGIMATGLGIGGPLGIFGALYHLFFHGVGKGLLFFVAGDVVQTYHTRRIHRIRGMLKTKPLTGGAFLAGILAITGTPPFALFVSEFSIAAAAFTTGKTGVGIAFLTIVAFLFGTFVYHTGRMVYGEPTGYLEARMAAGHREAAAAGDEKPAGSLARAVVMGICLVLLLAGGIFVPEPVRNILIQAGRVLGVA